MKKLGLLFVIVIISTTITLAQNRGGQRDFDPEKRTEQEVKVLTEKLDLSKDQQKKVHDVVLTGSKQMADMRKEMMSGNGDREAMREKMGKVRDEQNKELKKILSEDQFEKYKKYQEERRSQRGGQR